MREKANRVSLTQSRKPALRENDQLCRTLRPIKCISESPISTQLDCLGVGAQAEEVVLEE